jgi:hypothetical protein
MYLLKIKGINQKSDHIQIRDENFTLILYFRFSNMHRALMKANLTEKEEVIREFIVKAEYGKIQNLSL